jgi:hypothetical protein
MVLGFAVILAVLPTVRLHAQGAIFNLQSFDGSICGWTASSGTTLTYDTNQDNTHDGGGSCRIVTDYSTNGLFLINADNVACCFCEAGVSLAVSNFTSLEFDVLWDNSSTVPLSWFNANFGGATQGIAVGDDEIWNNLCYSNIIIPDAATNGWAHVSAAFNPAVGSVTFTGLVFKKSYPSYGTGSAAFWVDNVALVHSFSLSPPLLSAGGFTVGWNARAGQTFTVLRSTNLITWETLATGYPAGGAVDGPMTFTETNASQPHAFYRITLP